MAILLGDDGTLDTVVYCDECGEEARYHCELGPGEDAPEDDEKAYAEFVNWAIEDFAAEHECEEENE